MRLTESLYLVGSGDMGFSLTHPQDCNVYLLNCGDGYVLIDSGVGISPELIEEQIKFDNINLSDLKYLILTHGHADHSGGAGYFSRKYNLQVIAPAYESEFIKKADAHMIGLDVACKAGFYPSDYKLNPCDIDLAVNKGQTFSIGNLNFKVYEAAGHSVGGACYFVKVDGRNMLFSGDMIFYNGFISLQNIPGADIQAYSRSILALENLKIDSLLTGHLNFQLNRGQMHIEKACKQFKQLGIPKNII